MTTSFAGGGVPMIGIVMPAMAIAFIPIVVIEARILGKRLFLEGRRAVRTSILANLVSSAIGVPACWLGLAAIQIYAGAGGSWPLDTIARRIEATVLQAPWVVSGGRESWIVPAAALVLLVPFFLVSWRVETAVARIMLREAPRDRVSSVVFFANVVTYAALALIAATSLLLRVT